MSNQELFRSARVSIESLEGEQAEVLAEQLTKIEGVHDTAQVLRTATHAADAYEAVTEADNVSTDLTELRDVVEVVNANEAWTLPTFTMLQVQLESMSRRLGLPAFDIGLSAEDFTTDADPKTLRVSTESMSKILEAVETSAGGLEERSVTALVDLIHALGEAVPKVKARLCELGQRIESENDRDAAGQVTFQDASIHSRLVVNNEIPESLANYVNEYCRYGDILLGSYSEKAFQSVMKAVIFQEGLSEASFHGFWESVSEKVKQISDPRTELTDSQMGMSLPGAGPLFTAAAAPSEDVIQVRDRLKKFTQGRRPVSLSDFSVEVQPSESATIRALQPSEIRDCVKYFTDLLCGVDINAVSQACKAAWVDAGRTVRAVKETLANSDESLLQALDDDEHLVSGYLETLFVLSAWPVLNYLTNLTLFAHAFVEYSNQSMRPEPEAEPVAEVAADDTVELTDNATVAETAVGTDEPELEDGDKPTEPSEVPDTGETPNEPQDATGDGELAVVENVDEPVADETSEAESESVVDLDGGDEESDTSVDLAADESEEEEESTEDEDEDDQNKV